jgi:putative ABC transport system permease protein
MIKNHFRIAIRNMMHNKISSFINISGLSLGITSVLLIILFIRNEISYDKFHKDADRIYQIVLNGNFNGQEFYAGNTAPPVGEALLNNFPEIESYTRIHKPNDIVVRYKDANGPEKFFTEKNVLAVDSNFLQLFDFRMLEGHPSTALLKPGSVVITEDMAKKYFGGNTATGKTLVMNEDKKPFLVTGVLKNIPAQSSIQFDFLTPMADHPVVKQFSWSWIWQQVLCYVKLRKDVKRSPSDIRQLEAKFPAMVRVQAADAFERIGKPFDEFISKGGKWNYHLLPLTEIHLHSANISIPLLSHLSNIKYVYIFGSIALFIIILACVNFMNLSTARSSQRAKEVGIRKVSGSSRGQLIRQFLTEAIIYSFISTFIAILLVILLIKPFSAITGEALYPDMTGIRNLLLAVVALALIVGLMAGSYPAFYLTAFNPASVLKGKDIFKSGKGNLLVRNVLVVFQFCISTIMIIGTMVVFKQLKFFRDANMGFNKENVVVINNTNRLAKSEESYREVISQIPGIASASITTSIPSGFLFGDSYDPEPEGNQQNMQPITLTSFIVDEEFIPVLKISLLKGRNFSRSFSDSGSVILNEEAVNQIGWKEPIGKYLRYPGGDDRIFKVVGIVRNFNIESLHSPITPFALFHTSSNTYDLGTSQIIARINPGNLSTTLPKLESKWKTFVNGEPFDFNFLNASFDAQYRSEKRLGRIFSVFAIMSIFIACLGLFGLCAYIAERRTKEIGVRKILGASVQDLVTLLSKDFLKLICISVFIAFPIAWWAMERWLEDFAYRISISWTVFIIAGLSTLAISLFTISFQAIKAAIANPVKNLRTE